MPTNKKNNTFGMFKITEKSQRVVDLGNGMSIRLVDGNIPGRIGSIGIISQDGKETSLQASDVMQASIVLQAVDRFKRFVCGYHGSFESDGNRMQKSECPHCHTAKIQQHQALVRNGAAQLEEDDG